MMIKLKGKEYDVIEDSRGAIDTEIIEESLTDYFDSYDYIVGDWAYGKLRLKGFNEKGNKNYNEINAYENVKTYLQDYCAYGCKYFIIKRINVDKR